MRSILALTSIRSDYDLMSRLFRLLDADPAVDLRLLVSGAHLSPAHGLSVRNIRDDGLTILGEMETLISADTPSSRLKTAAGLLYGSIDLVKNFAPDLIIYAGDREDVLVGAMLGGFLGIPTVHFFGGDHAADGHIDNPVRHAASKLSTLHFVSVAEHRARLLRLGEPSERIHVIGSVALDKFIDEPTLPLPAVLAAMGAGAHAFTHPLAILIFHPISEEAALAGDYVRSATQALTANGYHVCIGAPNTDPGNFALNQALEALAQDERVTLYRNLARGDFINLFRHAQLIAGNSSAGLLEAASLRIPAINIGKRQRGRLCGANVLFTDGSRAEFDAALRTIGSAEFGAMLATLENPYGHGRSSETAAALLTSIDFAPLLKKPEDPLYAVTPL